MLLFFWEVEVIMFIENWDDFIKCITEKDTREWFVISVLCSCSFFVFGFFILLFLYGMGVN